MASGIVSCYSMENLKLRRALPSDSEFAYQTKKLAFGKYVEQVWGWDEAEQRRLHRRRFDSQEVSVIEWSGIEVGILSVVRGPDGLRLHQLFILPEYQDKGIGKTCMMRIIDDASAAGSPIKLQVLKVNRRAAAFFRGLGFEIIGESDTHILMERTS